MPELNFEKTERYLASVLGKPGKVLGVADLGQPLEDKPAKGFGYGTPMRIDYRYPLFHRHVAEHPALLFLVSTHYNKTLSICSWLRSASLFQQVPSLELGVDGDGIVRLSIIPLLAKKLFAIDKK